jgi:hypothetical protein
MDRLGESKLHTTSQLAGRRPRTVMVAVNAGIRRNRNCQTPGLHEITEIIARRSRSCPNEPHPRRHAPTNGGTDNQAHQRPHRTATQVWCGISRQKTPAPNVPVPTPDGSPVRPPGNHMLAALAKGVGGQTTVRQFGSMATPQDVPHGTLVGWGCRCTCCSAAGPAPAKSLEDIRRVLTDAARKPPDRPTGS